MQHLLYECHDDKCSFIGTIHTLVSVIFSFCQQFSLKRSFTDIQCTSFLCLLVVESIK